MLIAYNYYRCFNYSTLRGDQEDGRKQRRIYFQKLFQTGFKENFKQSTIMWIILLLLALIPTIDLYIINSFEKTIVTTALKGLMLAAALAILFVFLYAMALQSTFENTIKNTLKNAFLMGIGHFPWTL